jgi:hypothetical protein
VNCPRCGEARSLEDIVCRRCKFFFEEGRFIEVTPPRAANPASHPTRRSGISSFLSRCVSRIPRCQGLGVNLASLIPGLGHVLIGRCRRGVDFFLLVLVLAALSVILFGQMAGHLVFGLAVSVHAYSIFVLTRWRASPARWKRIAAMMGILALLLGLYWPLIQFLADCFVQRRRMTYEWRSTWGETFAVQLLLVALGIAVSIALAFWVGRLFSSRNRGEGT